MANIETHFNTSTITGANTQIGTVTNHILPEVILALREEIWMLKLCSRDFEPTIAQYGDTITYEKILGVPDIVDLSTDGTLTFSDFTVSNDYCTLDRYVGCVYAVKELEMLLAQNSTQHWDGFMANTIKKIAEYVEADVKGLYASMTNTYGINGPLTKAHYPIIRRYMKRSTKERGPWAFLVSDYDYTNLISDTDLMNFGFTNETRLLRNAMLLNTMFNIATIDDSTIPDVAITSPAGYNTMFHNICFDKKAIQFFSRRLGIPKMFTSTVFMEVIDKDSGLAFRIRIIGNAQRKQPRYEIVFEILYGIKLKYDEFAMDVTTIWNIA